MGADSYTLKDFIVDVDRITHEEHSGRVITERVAPLLGRLVKDPASIPADYLRRPAAGRGPYMLHRAPTFNVTSVIWRPGDRAGCHDHDTWGVIGVIDNEIEETRYHVTPGRAGAAAKIDVTSVTRHAAGAVSCLIPGDDEVHGMYNPTDRDTVEIHVYGKDLFGLPRTTWDADGAPRPLVSGKYLNC